MFFFSSSINLPTQLGLYQNNGFSQYLTRAVYDAPTRSLAPDTLTSPKERLVLSEDIDAFDALRRLAAMCDAAGVQHNIRLVESVQLNEQTSIRVEDNGRLGLYVGEGFEQYLTQAFYHPTHRRLCPDTLTAPTSRDAVEIAEDRLGSVLGDVVAACEMAGVRHNIVLPPLPSSPPPVSRRTSAASVSSAARSSTVAAAAAAAAAKSSSSPPLSQQQPQQSARDARRTTDSERDGGRRSGSRRRGGSVDGRRGRGRQKQQQRSRSRSRRHRRRSGSASSDSADYCSDDDDDDYASSASSLSSSPPRRHRSRRSRSRSRSRRKDEGRRRRDNRRHHRHESPSARSTPSAPASPPPPPPPAATGPTEAEKAMAAELERVRRELARTQELLRVQQPRSGSGSGGGDNNSSSKPRAAPVERRSSAASSAFAPAASAGGSVGVSTAVAEPAFCVHLLAAPTEGAETPQALAFDRPPTIGEVLREVPPPPPGSAEAAEAAAVLWVETPSEPLLTGVYALSGGETWNGAGVWAGADADHVLFLNDSGKWTLATKRSHMRRSTGWVKARRALGAGALPHEVRAWVTNDGKAWRPDPAAAVAPLRKLMLRDRDGIWTRVVTSDQLYPGCRLWVGSTEDSGGAAAATATATQRRPGPAPFAGAAAAAPVPVSGGGGVAASAAGGVGGPGGAGGSGQLRRPLPQHHQQRRGAATPSGSRGASPVGSPPRRSPPLPPRPFSTPALPAAEGGVGGGAGVGRSIGSSAYAAFGLGRPGSGGGGGGGSGGGEVGGDTHGARPVHHRCISPTRPKKGSRASYPPDPRSQTGGS